jgi:hypothetical protein
MSPATNSAVRERAVLTVECDIPEGITIAEYRARRRRPRQAGPRLLRRLRRR